MFKQLITYKSCARMSTKTSNLEKLQFFSAKNQFEVLSNDDVTESIYHSLEYLKNQPETAELKIVKSALSIALEKASIRLDLATKKGFYRCYFQMLSEFSSQEETFDYVNKEHEKAFGEKKYRSYKTFREALKEFPFEYNETTMKLEG